MSVADGLLVLLRDGPSHGYHLAGAFAARTADRWKLNTGQIYTTLERLVRDGFVEESGVDPDDERRRVYRLTDTGAERAAAWLRDAAARQGPQRDELVLRVLLVAAVDPAEALVVITEQRHALLDGLRTIRRSTRDDGGDLLARMLADADAGRIEADLAWLDRCEERLRDASRTNEPALKGESR